MTRGAVPTGWHEEPTADSREGASFGAGVGGMGPEGDLFGRTNDNVMVSTSTAKASATATGAIGEMVSDAEESSHKQWLRERSRQPAQLSGRAICAYENSTLGIKSSASIGKKEGERKSGATGEEGMVPTRQLKEMSFLQDLAEIEAEERAWTFKASTLSFSCFKTPFFSFFFAFISLFFFLPCDFLFFLFYVLFLFGFLNTFAFSPLPYLSFDSPVFWI